MPLAGRLESKGTAAALTQTGIATRISLRKLELRPGGPSSSKTSSWARASESRIRFCNQCLERVVSCSQPPPPDDRGCGEHFMISDSDSSLTGPGGLQVRRGARTRTTSESPAQLNRNRKLEIGGWGRLRRPCRRGVRNRMT